MSKITKIITFLLLASSQIQAQQKGKRPNNSQYGGTRYVYTRTVTNEPIMDSYYSPSPSPGVIVPKVQIYYKPELHTYLSNIVTITNYTEEKEYRFKDECSDKIKQTLAINNERASVVYVTVHAFRTYKEASISRSEESSISIER